MTGIEELRAVLAEAEKAKVRLHDWGSEWKGRARTALERAEAAEAEVARLREALAGTLAYPRYLSIGSIDNIVQLRRLDRGKYESLLRLAKEDTDD